MRFPWQVFAAALVPWVLAAQVQVPPGFTVRAVNVASEITGLAMASGGAYGTDLYASTNGQVLRVNPWSGTMTPFATGLATGALRPSGLAFDPGTLGTDLLHMTQNDGTVVRVSPNGVWTPFVVSGLFSCNDLAFAPPGSAFPAALYVSNGDPPPAPVSRVLAGGSASIFSPASNFTAAPLGLAFPPQGSAFPMGLYVAVYLQGIVRRLDSGGAATTVATGAGTSIDLAFATPGAGFGDTIYVTDPLGGRVLRIEVAGAITTFASGLMFGTAGWDAEIAFSPDGSAMFVTSGTQIVIVQPPCTNGGGQPNTMQASLLVNGRGTEPCSGRIQSPLYAPGAATFELLGPPNQVGGIFAGWPSPPLPLGCVGAFELQIPAATMVLPVILGPSGRGLFVLPLPPLGQGPLFEVQGAVTQAGSCGALFTATHSLSIR